MIFHITRRPIRTNLSEIQDALSFTGERLLGAITNKLQIDLRFVDGMMRREKQYASCTTSGEKNPRLFQIRLDDMLARKRALVSCCHEMVHVEQIINGKLAYQAGTRVFWKNVEYQADSDYSSLPWEKEAHELEDELYLNVLSQLRLKRKSKIHLIL